MMTTYNPEHGAVKQKPVSSTIDTIVEILASYPDGTQILKELLQNADDAEASRVEFLLDYTEHGTEHLINGNFVQYQGPALYAWNNSIFTKKDWEGFEKLTKSDKKYEKLKVGRFGVGLCSIYHLTDVIMILSDTRIEYSNPVNEENTGEFYSPLDIFFSNKNFADHHNCFKGYFDYNGEPSYNGTIFRFPLRKVESEFSKKIYNAERVKIDLFDNLASEAQDLLLYLKFVNSISLYIKMDAQSSRVLYYSVSLEDKYLKELKQHRSEMYDFALKLKNSSSGVNSAITTRLYISLYPIICVDARYVDHQESRMVWLVTNMIGFGKQIGGFLHFYREEKLEYLPWSGIAMPTGIKELNKFYALSFEWPELNIEIVIQSLATIQWRFYSDEHFKLDSAYGKMFCFLPTSEQSKFPFHIHGYFGLSRERNKIHWVDNNSEDGKWNVFLVEKSIIYIYAIVLRFSIQCICHPHPEEFHYKLWSSFSEHEHEKSMFSSILSGGMRLLSSTPLVHSRTYRDKWILLSEGYYLPSTLNRPNIRSQDTCVKFLENYSKPIVKLPDNVSSIIRRLRLQIEDRIIDPPKMRKWLREYSRSESQSFFNDRKNAVDLLNVILDDLDFDSENISIELKDIPLLLTMDPNTPQKFLLRNEYPIIYISEHTTQMIKMFPGLESIFIDPSLPIRIHSKLLQLAKKDLLNLKDFTFLRDDTKLFAEFLKQSMTYMFGTTTGIIAWKNECGIPKEEWIKSIWDFIGSNHHLLVAVQNFSILPQESLDSEIIHLLPLKTSNGPYVERKFRNKLDSIEKLFQDTGCVFFFKNYFIPDFSQTKNLAQFTIHSILPNSIFDILKDNDNILTSLKDLLKKFADVHEIIPSFNSLDLSGTIERNIIKSLPIFLNTKGKFISLNEHFALPPKSIPDLSYPTYILSPFNNEMNRLYQKLGLIHETEQEFIVYHFKEFLSNNLFSDLIFLEDFTEWIFNIIGKLEENCLSLLRCEKWILDDSESPMTSSVMYNFKSPSSLLDPSDTILFELSRIDSQNFPHKDLYKTHIEKLKIHFKLITHYQLTMPNLMSICREVIDKFQSDIITKRIQWKKTFKTLIYLLVVCYNSLNLSDYNEFWLIFKTDFILPIAKPPKSKGQISSHSWPSELPFLGAKNLLSPSQILVCFAEDFELVSSVTHMLWMQDILSEDLSIKECKNILKSMGCGVEITNELVILQLKEIIKNTNFTSDEKLLFKILSKIYSFLDNNPPVNALLNLREFIFIPHDKTFVDVDKLTKGLMTDRLCDLKPYIYCISDLKYNCDFLFEALKVSNSPTDEQLVNVIQQINKKYEGKKVLKIPDLDIVINILYHLSKSGPNSVQSFEDLFVPSHDGKLYKRSDSCLFYHLHSNIDFNSLQEDKGYVVVHERISSIASVLGIPPISDVVELSVDLPFDEVSQGTSLISTIQDILGKYSSDDNILKEMLQNADDAEATEMNVLFDFRQHYSNKEGSSNTLLNQNMYHCQGSAIYFYNNSNFSSADFKNILRTKEKTKENDVTKIGRFGAGFCTVYHVTDVPSFVSGGNLFFLDPQQCFLNRKGVKLDCANTLTGTLYKDQLEPFQGIFNCNILNRQVYNGTLFRLPLRSKNSTSDLSTRSFPDENSLKELIEVFINTASNDLLLFTQKIKTIKMYVLHGNNFTSPNPEKIFECNKKYNSIIDGGTFIKQNSQYLDSIKKGFEVNVPPLYCECILSYFPSDDEQTWAISYAMSSNGCANILKLAADCNKSIQLPVTATAFNLDQLKAPKEFVPNLFCFLPLSTKIPFFPFHCHGVFELDESRQGLANFDSKNCKSDWNRFLISQSLVTATDNLLINIAGKVQNSRDLKYTHQYLRFIFKMLSPKFSYSHEWKEFSTGILNNLLDSKFEFFHTSTKLNPNEWSNFNSLVLLDKSKIETKLHPEINFHKFIKDALSFMEFYGLKVLSVPSEVDTNNSALLNLMLEKGKNVFDLEKFGHFFLEKKMFDNIEYILKLLPALIASSSKIQSFRQVFKKLPCIPCMNNNLSIPSQVVDANNKLIFSLFPKDRQPTHDCAETLFKNGSQTYHELYTFLSITATKLRMDDVKILARKVETEQNFELAINFIKYLNEYKFNAEEIDQHSKLLCNFHFIPIFVPSGNNSFTGQRNFGAPKEMYPFALKHFVESQHPIISEDLKDYKLFLDMVGITFKTIDNLDTNIVIQELNKCVNGEYISESDSQMRMKLVDIYSFLGKRLIQSQKLIIKAIPKNCVFIPKQGFKHIERVLINCEFQLYGHLFIISDYYGLNDSNDSTILSFFKCIGVDQNITLKHCELILKDLSCYTDTLSNNDTVLATKLIQYMAKDNDLNDVEKYMLCKCDRVYSASNCLYYDLGWMKEHDFEMDEIQIKELTYYFIHPSISVAIAKKLGVRPLSVVENDISGVQLQIIDTNDLNFEAIGPKEDLLNRLNSIAAQHTSLDVLKELLQNADDAKATIVRVLFDYTSHPNERLLTPKCKALQGPALYFFNNAMFSEDDFKNIMNISSKTKLSSKCKIGRFGQGFNSVYRITDVPSFVSNNRIQFIDPHCHFLEGLATKSDLGIAINKTSNNTGRIRLKDQFAIFDGIFNCDIFSREPYNATLFRFPFRLSSKKTKFTSKILPKVTFDSQSIERLQTEYTESLKEIMLFLMNVELIEIYQKKTEGDSIEKPIVYAKKINGKISFINNHTEHFNKLEQHSESKLDHVHTSEVITIEHKNFLIAEYSSEEFIVCHASGTGSHIRSLMKNFETGSLIPMGSVAIPRRFLFLTPEKLMDEKCSMFCFLPLSASSPYPVHINGYFQVLNSREDIARRQCDNSEWNKALIDDALVNCYIHMFAFITQYIVESKVDLFYSLWPRATDSKSLWDDFPIRFAEELMNVDLCIFYCALSKSGRWLKYSQASFFSEEVFKLKTDFFNFLKQICYLKNIYIIDIPRSFYSNEAFSFIFKNSISKVYTIKRICTEALFPALHTYLSKLNDIKLILTSLLHFPIETQWLIDCLRELPCIPCGEDDPVLLKPSEVVDPYSKLAGLYYADDKRLPHQFFKELFSQNSRDTSHFLSTIGIIKNELPKLDIVDRCEKIVKLDSFESKLNHSKLLINYFNTLDELSEDICTQIKQVPFIPAWNNNILISLNLRSKDIFVPACKCYNYEFHLLLSQDYYAIDNEFYVQYPKAMLFLGLKTKNITPDIVLDLLEVFIENENLIDESMDSDFQCMIQNLYIWLADYTFPKKALISVNPETSEATKSIALTGDKLYPEGDEQLRIRSKLVNKPWLWHPVYRKFYNINQVLESDDYLKFNSKFVVSFPYSHIFKRAENCNIRYFFNFVGFKNSLSFDDVMEIFVHMKNYFGDEKLPEMEYSLVIELLFKNVSSHKIINSAKEKSNYIILSQQCKLHYASELYINDIRSTGSTSESENKTLVHELIHPRLAQLLGAKSKLKSYSDFSYFSSFTKFGQHEDMSSRINGLKESIPCDVTIFKELIQNAEDAKATEIAFILDNQRHPGKLLIIPDHEDSYDDWKTLQELPALLVYNNQEFTKSDIEGIQKVGIGGKEAEDDSIGKFGVGFISVYHLTDTPCLYTSFPGENNKNTFCFFDPYRKIVKQMTNLPGFSCNIDEAEVTLRDQTSPYKLSAILQKYEFNDTFQNLREQSNYSIFRLPINEFNLTKEGRLIKTRSLMRDLIDSLQSFLVFLKHIQRIDVFEINKNGDVICLGSSKSIQKNADQLSRDIPRFGNECVSFIKKTEICIKEIAVFKNFISFSNALASATTSNKGTRSEMLGDSFSGNKRAHKTHNSMQDNNSPLQKVKYDELTIAEVITKTKWLCYNVVGSVEELTEIVPDLKEFKEKFVKQKFSQVFGGIAIRFDIGAQEMTTPGNNYLFCHLPFQPLQLPIQINLPFILDVTRQHFMMKNSTLTELSTWKDKWHMANIQHILAPLYAKALLDLRSDPFQIIRSEPITRYHTWYYNLFPNMLMLQANTSENSHFIAALSKEVYSLFHSSADDSGKILISEFLITPTWYTIGDKISSGVFKNYDLEPKSQILAKIVQKLHKALIKIEYPLTFAPPHISASLQYFKLSHTIISPTHVLNYLNQNTQKLSKHGTFPCKLEDANLSEKEVYEILRYIVGSELNLVSRIPLKVDYAGILCNFLKDPLTYYPEYAMLLPNNSNSFFHQNLPSDIQKTLSSHFITSLDMNYLAKNIVINEATFPTTLQYILFWDFAIRNCNDPQDLIQLFGTHLLVPVSYLKSNTEQYFHICELENLVSISLKSNNSILFNILKQLECPVINIGSLENKRIQSKPSIRQIKPKQLLNTSDIVKYIDKISISREVTANRLVSCLNLAKNLNYTFSELEASTIRNMLTAFTCKIGAREVDTLSKLKIFMALDGKVYSICSCDTCYFSEDKLNLGNNLFRLLQENKILLFSGTGQCGNPISIMRNLASQCNKKINKTINLFSEYIIPWFAKLPFNEQRDLIKYVFKLEESVKETLIEQLKTTAFIHHPGHPPLRANQCYSSEIKLFKEFVADYLLPKEWENCIVKSKLITLGLHVKADLRILYICAKKIEAKSIKSNDNIKECLISLLSILKEKELISQGSDDKEILQFFSNVKFLPIWKYKSIEKLEKDYSLGKFSDAMLPKYANCCSTTCWIHHPLLEELDPQNIESNPSLKYANKIFGLTQIPKCNDVIIHLGNLVNGCLLLQSNDINKYVPFFYETYNYLQDFKDPLDLSQLQNKPCILFKGHFYSSINMVMSLDHNLDYYLMQVPDELKAYTKFLSLIGVKTCVNYTHFLYVLDTIYDELTKNNDFSVKEKSLEDSCKKAFGGLIKQLRMEPQSNCANAKLLTEYLELLPSNEIIYADNIPLLSTVRKVKNTDIKILRLLSANKDGFHSPPDCLNVKYLSTVFHESLSSATYNHCNVGNILVNKYLDILSAPTFYRALIRLYYNETGKDISKLRMENNKLVYSDDPTNALIFSKSIFDLLKNINIVATTSIDISLYNTINKTSREVKNAYKCYMDTKKETMIININSDYTYSIPLYFTLQLNRYLDNLFEKSISALQICFLLPLDDIMMEFDGLNIIQCPFISNVALPKVTHTLPPPATLPTSTSATLHKFTPAILTRPTRPAYVTYQSLLQYRYCSDVPRTREGIGCHRIDKFGAKLWIQTAQHDHKAAARLIKKSETDSSLYPAQACFLCFEAVMKFLIGFLHLKIPSCHDIYFIRNLVTLVDKMHPYFSHFDLGDDIFEKLKVLVIPLMNCDEDTRIPCCTPGIGCFTPQEHFSKKMAQNAVKNTKAICDLLKNLDKEFAERLMASKDVGMEIQLDTSKLLEEKLMMPIGENLKEKLDVDSEEFYTIARSFFTTMPNSKIITIEKIYNRECWDTFKKNVEKEVIRNPNCFVIRPLFHGSNRTDPNLIIKDHIGFNINFARTGMWGKGLYFAVNASYSNTYAYKLGNGELCMFLARVFVGCASKEEPNNILSNPPPNYHSIQGETNGSTIYIQHQGGYSYPSYLITYSNSDF